MALNPSLPILTNQEAAKWDKDTITKGLPSPTLMAMAAQSVFDALKAQPWFTPSADFQILTGPGNNGGDGYVLAWLLAGLAHKPVRLFPYAAPATEDAKFYYQLCQSHNYVTILPWKRFQPKGVTAHTILIDAIFGSGFNRELPLELHKLFQRLSQRPGQRVALDIPSGIWGDGTAFQHQPFPAHLTITIGALKPGLLLPPGILHCGEVVVTQTAFVPAPALKRRLAYSQSIPPLKNKASHKYSSGVLHLFGGSAGMEGSCVLAARAFLGTGGGLCRWYTTSPAAASWLSELPEIMIRHETNSEVLEKRLLKDLQASRQPLLAMGMGLAEEPSPHFMEQLFQVPNLRLVADASVLPKLKQHEKLIANRPQTITTVLTPHAGEAAALLGATIHNIREVALELARRFRSLVYFKGPGGLLTTPDGHEIYFNSQEFSLATGGTGDILSGLIANYLSRSAWPAEVAVEQAILCQLQAARAAEHPENLTASGLITLCRRQHAILQQIAP